ncbi:hypothetical protein G6F46_001594 [Rhizopus delemar]|nr:hypothetical protein G6F50_000418 [Rhizopus delemar]KAG1621474.1 hypothetical protein G6F46_001594 [Rhizopus delemar]
MLSASTSNAYSGSLGILTPPLDSQNHIDFLDELTESEKRYMETLRMIDTQIASIWMKQTTSTAPDFSELLKHVNEISKTNKQFFSRIARISHQQEFNQILLQWIDDLEVPYSSYCRSYIPNLKQRTDILSNSFISSLIQDLSSKASYEITLQSLFEAPLQQLKYYKTLYAKLFDQDTFLNKKIDKILALSQKRNVLSIQTGFESDLQTFQSQVNTSRTMDFFGGTYIDYKQLNISNPESELVMIDSFDLVTNQQTGSTIRVHLVLTTEVLVICRELNKQSYSLMYPPLPIGDIVVKTDEQDRIHLSVMNRRNLVFRADSKEIRNMWIGADQNSSLSPCPLDLVAQKKMLSAKSNKPNIVKNTDIFTFYSENGAVSPLESSDDEEEIPKRMIPNSRDTIIDIYDNHLSEGELANVAPQSVKILPKIPHVTQATTLLPPKKDTLNVPSPIRQPVKDVAHVQMTYIQAPTAQMGTMTISKPSSPSSLSSLKSMNSTEKPSSPRAIEVQRAVVPEIMQAVTQNTEEYLETTMKKSQPVQTMPRTVSKEPFQKPLPPQPHHQQNYLQRPPHHQPHAAQPRPSYGNRPPPPPSHQYYQHHVRPQQSGRPMNAPPSANNQVYQPQNGVPPNQQAMRPQRPQYSQPSPPPGRFNSPSPPSLPQMNNSDEWNSPPHSPSAYVTSNGIKQVIYNNNQCDVFHWNNQTWYAADGQCLLQVRLTHNNRTCMAVELQNKGQLYLNAWILPTTLIRQTSPTDVSLSVFMGTRKENYLVHFHQPQEAATLVGILHQAHREATQQQQAAVEAEKEPMEDELEEAVEDNVNCPQTLKPVMQCKAKLFVQTETSKWNTFGSVSIRISQQAPSMRMMIQIENDKTKLVSAVVRSGNVEKISSKRISFLLSDESQKTSIVYMIQLREEQTGSKVYEYLRIKNAEYGW